MKRLMVCVSVAILWTTLCCFGAWAENPITIIDIEGREVKLTQAAQRIVDLTGLGGTRILIQLAAHDRVVGMTDLALDVFNPESNTYQPAQRAVPEIATAGIANVGDWKEPNVEKILSLNPDVILVGWSGKEAAEKLQQQTGVPTVCIGRMDGHFDYERYRIVGKIIGKEEKAEEIITYIQRQVKTITDVVENIPEEKRKRVFFWIVPRANTTLRTNGIYDAIDYAGGINVASTERGIGLYETTKEQVVAWDPDVIFLQSSHKKGVSESYDTYLTIEEVKQDPILSSITAVQNNQVYYLRGPRSDWDTAVEATEVFYMAKLFYPEMFEHVDVEKEGNAIFKALYRVEGLYTDMSENVGLYQW